MCVLLNEVAVRFLLSPGVVGRGQRKLLEKLADLAGDVSCVPLDCEVPNCIEVINKKGEENI